MKINFDEIKIGDYIETKDGVKGNILFKSSCYPCNIYLYMEDCFQKEWCYTREQFMDCVSNGRFVRIGNFVSLEHENKIKPIINKEFRSGIENKVLIRFPISTEEIVCKINEIIDVINKEGKE